MTLRLSTLASRVRSAVGAAVLKMPEAIKLRVIPGTLGYRARDIPRGLRPPDTPVRLLIAPANYAGQGYAWARAAEKLPGVGARNLEIVRSAAFGFPHDAAVSEHIATLSPRWSRRQLRAIQRFTHVLVEAERPILGSAYGGDLVREHAALIGSGIRVAYVSHGSDLRLPSRHASLDEWSPFRDKDWNLVPVLEEQAAFNAAALRAVDARVFVPTPELLLDVPDAVWLPIVVDAGAWAAAEPPLRGGTPVVMHSPTNTVIKGSQFIDPIGDKLRVEGVIEYRRTHGVPAAAMPAAVASADVVLEQFRLGIYATTAIEAMAAGRLVVGHVTDQVRDHVKTATGHALPVVEATPATLEALLRDIAERPEHYHAEAAAGPAFVRAVHDGRFSSHVLEGFLVDS
jgi:hypothetical protein